MPSCDRDQVMRQFNSIKEWRHFERGSKYYQCLDQTRPNSTTKHITKEFCTLIGVNKRGHVVT